MDADQPLRFVCFRSAFINVHPRPIWFQLVPVAISWRHSSFWSKIFSLQLPAGPSFNQIPASRKIGIPLWQGQNAVQMIREQHPGINMERSGSASLFNGVMQCQSNRFIAQDRSSVKSHQCEKPRRAGSRIASIS